MSTRKWGSYDVEFFDGECKFDELEFSHEEPFIVSDENGASMIVNVVEYNPDAFYGCIDLNVSISLSQMIEDYIDTFMSPEMVNKEESDTAKKDMLSALKKEIEKIESYEYVEKSLT